MTNRYIRANKHYSKADKEKIAPIVFIELPNSDGKRGTCLHKTLLDSGVSSSEVNNRVVQHLEHEQAKIKSFSTVAGKFNCTKTSKTQTKCQS